MTDRDGRTLGTGIKRPVLCSYVDLWIFAGSGAARRARLVPVWIGL